MRVMFKVKVPTPEGNELVATGKMGEVVESFLARVNPEAVYFTLQDGRRTMFCFANVEDSAELPILCEPLFQSGAAEIECVPAMNSKDMKKALAALQGGA